MQFKIEKFVELNYAFKNKSGFPLLKSKLLTNKIILIY